MNAKEVAPTEMNAVSQVEESLLNLPQETQAQIPMSVVYGRPPRIISCDVCARQKRQAKEELCQDRRHWLAEPMMTLHGGACMSCRDPYIHVHPVSGLWCNDI